MCTLLCPHGLENHSSVLCGISGNSEQKTILQTTEQPIQFRVFRDSVPVLKIHGCN